MGKGDGQMITTGRQKGGKGRAFLVDFPIFVWEKK